MFYNIYNNDKINTLAVQMVQGRTNKPKVANVMRRLYIVFFFTHVGTSWLQQIVYFLMHGVNDTATLSLTCDQRVPYLEGLMPAMDKLAAAPSPRVIKTHLPYQLLPPSVHAIKPKVGYIIYPCYYNSII
jgi:hypothetical protein